MKSPILATASILAILTLGGTAFAQGKSGDAGGGSSDRGESASAAGRATAEAARGEYESGTERAKAVCETTPSEDCDDIGTEEEAEEAEQETTTE